MKNKFLVKIIQGIGIAVGILGVLGFFGESLVTHAAQATVYTESSAVATTTVSYIGVGTATSTYQFDNTSPASGKIFNTSSVDSYGLYVQMAASSTSSTLNVIPQYSNNGIDWYSLGTATTTLNAAGVSVLAYPTTYQWTPGTTATSSMVFMIPFVPALHARVQLGMTGAAGAVYNEVDLKLSSGS